MRCQNEINESVNEDERNENSEKWVKVGLGPQDFSGFTRDNRTIELSGRISNPCFLMYVKCNVVCNL